jgi:hypothetical protein
MKISLSLTCARGTSWGAFGTVVVAVVAAPAVAMLVEWILW